MNSPTETFVVDLPSGKKRPTKNKRVRKRAKAARRSAKVSSLGIPGTRIRTQRDLESVFLRERGTSRPSLFVASTAAHFGPLAEVAHHERGNLRLLLLEEVPPERKEFLQTLFRTVISLGGDLKLLEGDELSEVLSADDREDLFVGGAVNQAEKVLVLYRGSFDRLAVPFDWFQRNSDVEPDFSDFGVVDFGQTVRFGEFEVAGDAVLYDFDPDYRSRARKRQLELDKSFGGSLRRLRELRGVRRSEFPSVSAKEIARIERGEVKKPHKETVNAIAKRLDVTPEELVTY